MTDIHEQEIAEQIDREIVESDSILALVVCLSAAAMLVVASAVSFLGVGI